MRKIDKLDVIHIKKKADTYIKKNTEIREGQALFCASYDLFPKSTDKLSGTPCDCFYEDSRMPIFLEELQKLDAEQRLRSYSSIRQSNRLLICRFCVRVAIGSLTKL